MKADILSNEDKKKRAEKKQEPKNEWGKKRTNRSSKLTMNMLNTRRDVEGVSDRTENR